MSRTQHLPTAGTAPQSHQLTGSASQRPRAASLSRRVLAQARFETMTMVRNGEQLLLLVILPVMALVGLTFTDLLDPYRVDGASRVDVAVPGILVLCVISSAFSGQGIQTGFDRRYGVLRHLSTTPLGRSGLIAGKLLAILAVLVLQYLVIAAVAAWLGWRPSGLAVLGSIPLLVLVAVTFTGLGMLIAGTLRAEATLAVLNVVWVALAAGGGVLFPLTALPGWLSRLVALLPSSAAGELVRECFLGTPATLAPLLVLGVWAVLSWAATVKWFRWV
ncbi:MULTISPECIES: ABC transporter permease [Kocuria]|uniref:Transport permease protein n=2 Tax=Kocuria TaxID=57493 RepID=A0A7D7Q139_KOCVA|nr:ABC transporter permease [Kocuria varians]MBS6029476.1 ABC transporter permease [Kocuria rhizophila]QMS57179.1 Daunorubicin/doxorubicin resistance ABC transporter permease protein DrrB [Kocuria varians]